ncbi:MAG: type III pantothenate kinase [Bacteroidales bacterium]|nr:type III pantothenate kinase [Bacteroidales bacterium]
MQNLILDFGNTLYKVAVFDQGNLIYKFSGKELLLQDLSVLKNKFPKLNKAIFSSVIDLSEELKTFLFQEFNAIELTHRTLLPIQNLYKTPETLGKDRLAAAVGASQLYPQKNILVIDAGSSITYEMVTPEAYLGGSISPGINMRFNSLHHFTGKLPLIIPYDEAAKLVGKTTEEAILSGVLNGILAEVDGIIEQYKNLYPDILVLFTGGDLNHFDKNLKNNIFAAENLVLQGLNFILEYNDNKPT